jgi:hypothetical protein
VTLSYTVTIDATTGTKLVNIAEVLSTSTGDPVKNNSDDVAISVVAPETKTPSTASTPSTPTNGTTGRLAFTGGAFGSLFGSASWMLLVGTGFVVEGRRRRRRTEW